MPKNILFLSIFFVNETGYNTKITSSVIFALNCVHGHNVYTNHYHGQNSPNQSFISFLLNFIYISFRNSFRVIWLQQKWDLVRIQRCTKTKIYKNKKEKQTNKQTKK